MHRHVIDRWTDATTFGVMLIFAGLAVVPVLAMGVLTTVIGGTVVLIERSPVELEQAVFALLSVGGALGFLGYLRARWGARDPRQHNITATLACLAAGVLAALSVAGFVLVTAVASWREPWGSAVWLVLGALFATANVVWALAGIGWMQRLARRYAEHTGRPFDGLPALLLLVAVALATTAALAATTL